MNDNLNSSLHFLKKYIPSSSIKDGDLNSVWNNIAEYVDIQKESVNIANDQMLNVLNVLAQESKSISDRLSVIGSMLADAYAISGKSTHSFDPFLDIVKSVSGGAVLDKALMQIKLQDQAKTFFPISSYQIITKNGVFGNSIDYDVKKYFEESNIFDTQTWLEIESYDSPVSSIIKVSFAKEEVINCIDFSLINFGVMLPEILSVETSVDGFKYVKHKIHSSNDFSFSPDDYRLENGRIHLLIDDTRAKHVRIIISQNMPYSSINGKDRYVIGINSFKTSFIEAVDNGDIVIGPFNSNKEILKVSVGAELINALAGQGLVTLFVSNDGSYWIPIGNSTVFEEGADKVISFNTKDKKAVQTVNPVKQLWVRVALKAIDKSDIVPAADPVDRIRSKLSKQHNNVTSPSIKSGAPVAAYQIVGPQFGKRESLPVNSQVQHDRSLVDILIGGNPLSRSLNLKLDSHIDMTQPSSTPSTDFTISVSRAMDVISFVKSETNKAILSHDADPYMSYVYKASRPRLEKQSFVINSNSYVTSEYVPVIPLKDEIQAGIYILSSNTFKYTLDVSAGIFYSSSELIYAVPNDTESVSVINQLNVIIGTLSTAIIDGQKYIELAPFFCKELPSSSVAEFSKHYPARILNENEFGLLYGRYVFGSPGQKDVTSNIVNYEKIGSSAYWSSDNKTGILLNDTKEIKASYELTGNDFKKAIKLKHTNIISGTVKFDTGQASINAFVREVPFKDGTSEFSAGATSSELLSKMYTSGEWILSTDKGIPLVSERFYFDGQNELFKTRVYSADELVSEGDWMVHVAAQNKICIRFPEGVTPDPVYDTLVTYSVDPTNVSTGGLYSIDYKNGILYTATPIDQLSIISYLYSYLFCEYEGLEQVHSEKVKISDGSISIETSAINDSEYLVLVQKPSSLNIKYKSSPILSDFKVNVITAGDVL